MKKFWGLFLVFTLVALFTFGGLNSAFSLEPVRLGVQNIDACLDVFEGKRVGLVTNATGVDSSLKSTIDVLHEKINLVALFAPEHGIRGTADAGELVDNDIDKKTGLKVFSLYGKTQKPTPEMLENIDVLTYDIQDVGARFYTYISTMKLCMQACKENGVTFVVLDRPNPLSSTVGGNILDEEFTSFVGLSKITTRYGLTPGETARYFNEEDGIGCELFVVEMSNYKKDMYYDETGLTWVKPSPSMATLDTAIVYVGTCIFEGTNLSEGRGTDKPFEYIGAPWVASEALAEKLNGLSLPGVNFKPISFIPCRSKYKDELCHGVFVEVLDRKIFDPVKAAFALFYTIREMHPDKLELNYMLELLTGGSFLKTGKLTLEELFQKLDNNSLEFEKCVQKYILYK